MLMAGAAVVLMVLSPMARVLLVSGIAAWLIRRRSGVERARMAEIERTLPDAIDLLSLVVSAGVPPRRAIAMVAARCPAPHREAWAGVTARTDAGEGFVEALSRLIVLLGPSVRPLVTALIAYEQDGVALGPALERCAAESHRRRRIRAEEAARRVPVLMLFPLVCCVLPAFGLLTIVPLLAGSVSDLQLPA
jgi:tight adherence protein C